MNSSLSGEWVQASDAPRGTVTFVFTDIEGSTRLREQFPEQYARILEEHHQILRGAFARWHGQEIDTQGDAFFVAFGRSTKAVNCPIL